MCDPCVYVKDDSASKVFIVLYVDALFVTGSSEVCISKTKAFLMTKFAMKDLGDVSLNLGLQVSRDRLNDTLDISRGNYVKAVLQRYGCVDGRSVSTPGAGKPLYLKFGTLLDDGNKLLYQETVGSIIYLSTCTRWDHCLLRNAANSGDEQSEG